MDFATSTGLSFAAGINAYLPLLGLAVAADVWPQQYALNPQFAFLAQGWCIAILVVLTLADFFADKIPGITHIWNIAHTILRPVAGALVAAAASHASGGWLPVFLALGAGLAAATHVTKYSIRITSSAVSAGVLSFFLSFVEDILAALSVLLSFILPYVMLVVVILFILVFLLVVPRIARAWRRRKARAARVPADPKPFQSR